MARRTSLVAVAVALAALGAATGCGWFGEDGPPPEPTLHPGATITADVTHVITESGAYVIPSGAFRLRLEAHGNITYRVETPTTSSSGTILLGGLGSNVASLSFSGPGAAVFGIESGYVTVAMSRP
jgi:hypothetical protein